MKRLWQYALVAGLTLAIAGLGLFGFGEFWRLSAIRQHPGWLYTGIVFVRDTIIELDADDVELPEDFAPSADAETAVLYQANCGQCHGGPGVAPGEFALGMMPVPPPLAGVAQERSAKEIFWFIRNGLKMSGMPAWEGRLSRAQMLDLTAFVTALPSLSPVEYKELVAGATNSPQLPRDTDIPARVNVALGDAERGRLLMRLHACRSCHEIPGLVGAEVHVGPDLSEAGSRRYIAGVLRNTPQNMVQWITNPPAVDPLTAMPDLGVTPAQAADMAAYLYQLSPPPNASKRAEEGDQKRREDVGNRD
ncbi:c-type cytochrome [Rhizobium halophilum]|uniref:c-type cytochrome n=1 Tax=Rhizobium halophilum TaxID=2846852 RepID=UPI001EFC5525|nr:c-type cytochrome [Rhizobium halophilum]MCF6369888.1 c-type cytochrome [Rhizobium halophilum]